MLKETYKKIKRLFVKKQIDTHEQKECNDVTNIKITKIKINKVTLKQ